MAEELDNLEYQNSAVREDIELDNLDHEPITAPKSMSFEDDDMLMFDSIPNQDVTDDDIKLLKQPDNPYETVFESQETPLIKEPEDSPEVTKSALDKAKSFGLAFTQGVWDGAEEIGYTFADIADSITSFEDPNMFRKWAESIEIQPEAWAENGELAKTANTANALAAGAGQFLSGFIPALKMVQMVKISGRVSPWMKKVLGSGVAGAAADFSVWDYSEKRAVDYMAQFGEELKAETQAYLDDPTAEGYSSLKKTFADILTSDAVYGLKYDPENDNAIVARGKQAAEGFVLGKVFDVVLGSVRMLARSKPKSIEAKVENKKTVGDEKVPVENQPSVFDPNAQVVPDEFVPIRNGSRVLAGEDGTGKVVKMSKKDNKATVEFKDGTRKEYDLDTLQSQTKARPKANASEAQIAEDFGLPKVKQTTFNKAWQAGDFASVSRILAETIEERLDNVTDLASMEKLLGDAMELTGNSVGQAKEWAKSATGARNAAQRQTLNQTVEKATAQTKNLDESILTMNMLDQALSKRLKEVGKKFTDNPTEANRQAFKQVAAHAYAMSQFSKQINGEVGRALNIMKYTKDANRLDVDKMFNEMQKQGWSNIDDAARMASTIADGDTTLLNALGERQLMRAWTEGFINSVLSPTSLGINITSNIIMMIARTADIHMAAFRGSGDITFKQAMAHTIGYMSALPEAFMVMLRSFKNDKAMFSGKTYKNNEFAPKSAITAENLGFRGENPNVFQKTLNSTINTIGKVIRGMPGGVRSMMATDEFFKILNHRAYIMKQAVESVEREGVNIFKSPKAFTQQVATKQNAIKQANDIKAKTGSLQDAENFAKHSQAMEEAHMATFTNKFGPSGENWYRTLRSAPWTSLFLPFVRQPVNNMLYVVKGTPFLNLASKSLSREIAAGGARAELALAHLNVSSMLWATAFFMAFSEGEKLRGNPKSDKAVQTETRELGIDPNTFETGEGDYLNYRGGEPIAAKWAIAAGLAHQWMKTMNEAGPDMTDEEIEEAGWSMAAAGALTVMDNFKDQSSLRGLEQTLKLLEGGTEGSLKKGMYSFLSGWISVMAGQIKWIRERYLGEDKVRYSTDTLAQHIDNRYGNWLSGGGKGNMPFDLQQVEAVEDLNSFGDSKPTARPLMVGEVFGNESAANPANYVLTNLRKTKGFEEDWQKEIVRVRQQLPGEAVLGMIPTRIEEVKIDNRERHNLLKILKHFKDGKGKTLADDMKALFKTNEYKKAPDKLKATLIHNVYRARMDAAKKIMIVDAAKYYKNPDKHRKQKHWNQWGLVDYGRSKSLFEVSKRQEAKDINRLLNKRDPDRIDVDKFEKETGQKASSAYDKMKKLFQ